MDEDDPATGRPMLTKSAYADDRHIRVRSSCRRLPQPRKLLCQSVYVVGRIEAARVRKDPQSRPVGLFRLRADRCPWLAEGGPVGGYAKNRKPPDAEVSGHRDECGAACPK